MSNNKDKVFHLNAAEVNQILFCDESDTEDALPLDDEDINFLESDMDLLSINRPNTGGQMEVVIESSSMTQRPNQDGTDCQSTRMTTSESESPSTSSLPSATTTATVSTDTTFKWKKMSKMRQKALAEKRLQQQPAESEFGEILLELEAETTPYQVFEKIANCYSANNFVQSTKRPCIHNNCRRNESFFRHADRNGLSCTTMYP